MTFEAEIEAQTEVLKPRLAGVAGQWKLTLYLPSTLDQESKKFALDYLTAKAQKIVGDV